MNDEIKKQILEMAQLKSEFDMEKFTVKKEGNFIAHNFHFLMRQYSLALHEKKRIELDIEETKRNINKWRYGKEQDGKYKDIEIERLENQIFMHEMELVNKTKMCKYFEKLRLKLIELNGGKAPTNEQYQIEEPQYWKWNLLKQALHQFKERQTGIVQGVWQAVDMVEEKPVINENYQAIIGSKFDIDKVEEFINRNKQLDKHEDIKELSFNKDELKIVKLKKG